MVGVEGRVVGFLINFYIAVGYDIALRMVIA
jgi:hypothetical protein